MSFPFQFKLTSSSEDFSANDEDEEIDALLSSTKFLKHRDSLAPEELDLGLLRARKKFRLNTISKSNEFLNLIDKEEEERKNLSDDFENDKNGERSIKRVRFRNPESEDIPDELPESKIRRNRLHRLRQEPPQQITSVMKSVSKLIESDAKFHSFSEWGKRGSVVDDLSSIGRNIEWEWELWLFEWRQLGIKITLGSFVLFLILVLLFPSSLRKLFEKISCHLFPSSL